MKRRDGRIAWFSKVVLFPYLAYTWLVWNLYRLFSREDAYNTIGEDLVIGRRLLASEVPDGFEHYVDLTAEFEDPSAIRAHESYHCLPILDAGVPSFAELEQTAVMAKEGRTYIHCAQGHGRTGLFALALLNQRGRIASAQEGIELLQSLRPAINLNREQSGFIERYLALMQNNAQHHKSDRAGESEVDGRRERGRSSESALSRSDWVC